MGQDTHIRFAREEDTESIRLFLKQNWHASMDLIESPGYFDYYFRPDGKAPFFAIAQNENLEMLGVCGFIPSSLEKSGAIWTSLWAVRKDAKPSLGVNILMYIIQHSGYRCICSNNIATSTMPIYRFLQYTAGRIPQYYRLQDRTQYSLLHVVEKEILPVAPSAYRLCRFHTMEDVQSHFSFETLPQMNPCKDLWYINHRYFHFEPYHYEIYGIQRSDGQFRSLLIGRAVCTETARMFRIVDFIGEDEDLAYIGMEVDRLIRENNYEFVEFFAYGVEEAIMRQAGFSLHKEDSPNIITSYLEPFSLQNRNYYFFTTNNDRFHMFKADGDQDRDLGLR